MPLPLYKRAYLRYNTAEYREEICVCALKNPIRFGQNGAKTHYCIVIHYVIIAYRRKDVNSFSQEFFIFSAIRENTSKSDHYFSGKCARAHEVFMRIDKFLKVSRILKRRTVAQEAADAGKIRVNGREVKPAYRVKIGDEVELSFTSGTLKFRVLAIKETVKKDEASTLYEVIA